MSEGRRYRVLGVIGRGGFGTVYRADLLGEGSFVRPVALKILNADMEDVTSVAERLRDEARLLGRIRHRAVVHVDGLVRLDDRWTIVMEYVDGTDLGRLLEQHGKYPVRPAFEIAGEVASALHVVHSWPGADGKPLGILHRDVKPANLLLTEAGEVKVLDFGVARGDLDNREAHTRNMRFGSPGYVAPERLEGEERPEGDSYSLGVVLYELLAARSFGKATVRKERHAAMMEQQWPHLPALPPEADTLLRRMLAWEPDERPSAREIERTCRDLAGVLPGPYLRDWAEKLVPATARGFGELGTDFSSEFLTERVSGVVETKGAVAAEVPSDPRPPNPSAAQPTVAMRTELLLAPPPPPPLPPPLPAPPPASFSAAPTKEAPPPTTAPATAPTAKATPPVRQPPNPPVPAPPGAPKRSLGLMTVLMDMVALSATVSVAVVVLFGSLALTLFGVMIAACASN